MRPETKQTAVLTSASALGAVLGIAFTAHVGRRLGPVQYADFATALAIVYFVSFALGPLASTAARFAAQSASGGHLGQARALLSGITRGTTQWGLACLAVLIAFSLPFSRLLEFGSHWPFVAAVSVALATVLLSGVRGVLRGLQQYGPYSVGLVVEAAVRLVSGIALLYFAATAAVGILAYGVAVSAAFALAWTQLQKTLSGHAPNEVDWLAVRRFTGPMFLITLGLAGFQNVDMVFVRRAFDATEAGMYGAALALARSLYAVFMPFNTMLLPMLAFRGTEPRAFMGTLGRVCLYFIAVAAGPLLVFAVWPRAVVVALYGEAFAPAAPLLLPLSLAMCLSYLTFLVAQALAAMDKFRFVPFYLACLLLEVVALLVWHETLMTVAFIVVVTQAITLAVLLGDLFIIRLTPGIVRRPVGSSVPER